MLYSKVKLINLLAIITGVLAYACVEDVIVDNDTDRKVVVNCMLTPDTVQTLKLTYTGKLGDLIYKEVETARAFLYRDSNLVGEFKKYTFSQWRIKYKPAINCNYKLVVEIPGRPAIFATTRVPDMPNINKRNLGDTDFKKQFSQNSPLGNCWMFVSDYRLPDSVFRKPKLSDLSALHLEISTNHEAADRFNTRNEWSSWGTYSSSTPFIYYIRLSNKGEIQLPNLFYIEGNFERCAFFFRAASDEYDRYMKTSFQKMLVYQSFDDPSQWFDENVVYSNINNGVGIFAAYTDNVIFYSNTPLP